MKHKVMLAAIAAGSALTITAPAHAAGQDPASADAQSAQPDASDATADAAIAQAQAPDDAQAKLEMLQAQVDALQASIEALKAATLSKDGTPSWTSSKASWAEKTSISGKAFLNVSSINHESDGVDTAQSGTQSELKRFYFGVEHRFDETFTANLTTDFRYNANGTSKDVLVYVKKAYLQAKFAPEFFVRVGAADLPWVPFAEGVYGYRYIENVLIDRTKYGTSSDWGVHFGGSLAGGRINYAASAINGAGYKTLSRSSNTVDFEGRISANPIKNVVVAVGGYTGKLGKSAENLPSTPHRATRWNALAAYTDSRIRLGVEYFHAKNWNNITTLASDSSSGWSGFGSFSFTPQLAVFGRYDWVKPSKDLNPSLKDNYFNVGLNYKPLKNIDVALVYKRDRAENGTISTSNGTIGGVDEGTYDEFGIFSQFSF